MSSLIKKIILSIFLLNAHQSFATTYYVCDCAPGADPGCIAGNDSNNGTSPNTPWQSTAKVKSLFSSFPAGTKILFAKGGSWVNAGMSPLTNTLSNGVNPIVFDSYTGSWVSNAKPILTESRTGETLIYFTNSGNATHKEGFTIRNLDIRGGGTGQWGICLYNDVDYVTLDHLSISGFGAGVYSADYGNPPNSGSNSFQDHLTITNCEFTNNRSMGGLITGSKVLVENNTFDNNGYATAIYDHPLYITGSSKGIFADSVIVRGNTFINNSIISGKCASTVIVGHDYLSNWLIENNTIYQAPGTAGGACYGIGFGPGNGGGELEGERNLIVRGNKIINAGYVSIAVNGCHNCTIENNEIVQENTGEYYGIRTWVPSDLPAPAWMNDSITVRNNSIYFYGSNDVSIGVSVKKSGTNNIVASNLVYYGAGPNSFSFGFETDYPASSFVEWNYNSVYGMTAGARWTPAHNTQASFTTATGFDANSLSNNTLVTIPNSGNNYSMELQSGSPAINNGSLVYSSIIDITGVARDIQPDIGAYEYRVSTQVKQIIVIDNGELTLFPNPSPGIFTVNFSGQAKNITITVLDVIGRTIALKSYINDGYGFIDRFNLNEFPDGLYIIKLQADDHVTTGKLFKHF